MAEADQDGSCQSPGRSSGDAAGEAIADGSGFSSLGLLSDIMNLGLDEEQGPRDAIMVNPSVMTLKKARSPPKVLTSGSSSLPSSKVLSSLAGTAFVHVSSSKPNMDGGWVKGGEKVATLLTSESGSPISTVGSSSGVGRGCAKSIGVNLRREKIIKKPMGGDGVLYPPEGGGNLSSIAAIGGWVSQPSSILS